ncbi:MAG: inositol monophosphatase, partial [Candidatus Omnitrophica bacterium]|nr:inositol monophosphatase [Candidatus Omnitrophota bacterium]
MESLGYFETAVLAAKEAGKIHKKYFNQKFEINTKGTPFDLVTVADIEAEKKIVEVIRGYFPSHNFLGEENNYDKTDSEYKWIIDPLDGTNNFAHSLPIFCVSIALAKNDELLLGIIYDPLRDELFYAEKNKGAFLNEQKISVSDIDKLAGSLLITGFYYDRGKDMMETLDKIRQFLQLNITGVRRLGSAALDLCYVACGRASGFWEYVLSPWDFSAGKLIVEEAGGNVTGRFGETVFLEKSYIVA